MLTRRRFPGLTAIIAVVWLTAPTFGEIICTSGSTSVEITEFRVGQHGDHDEASAAWPGDSNTLPLQVVAGLATLDEEAAGSVAAQFADPLTTTGQNPEEFAINLTLNSLSEEIHYTAQARAEETRQVLLSPGEVALAQDGQTVKLVGRLFVDGVLAVFAVSDVDDLTDVGLTLRITVHQQVEDGEPQQVFAGSLSVSGDSDGTVTMVAVGDIPTNGIMDADLAQLDEELGVFRVFVLPALTIDYDYEAMVGQPFSLQAVIEVEAANRPGGVGVAAILGTPIDTLAEVIELTRGAAAAKRMTAAVQKERETPTGQLTFPVEQPPLLLPLCGLLGWEAALGVVGLIGLRRVYRHQTWNSEP